MLFRKSSRYVPSDRLDSLIRMLPERVTPVLLFVNPDPDEVSAVTRRHPEVLLQFHGEETPEFCRAFGLPYMKAVHFENRGICCGPKPATRMRRLFLPTVLRQIPARCLAATAPPLIGSWPGLKPRLSRCLLYSPEG